MKKTLTFLLPIIALTCVACDQQRDTNRTNTNTNTNSTRQERTMKEENRRVSMTYGSHSSTSATDHSLTDTDRALTQKIRQALLNDNSLAISVKNIQISANDGIVTLRGTVLSDREKTLIANKVRMINGVNSIENHLDVSTSNSRTTRDSQY